MEWKRWSSGFRQSTQRARGVTRATARSRTCGSFFVHHEINTLLVHLNAIFNIVIRKYSIRWVFAGLVFVLWYEQLSCVLFVFRYLFAGRFLFAFSFF